jgi:hypothetical protein
MLNVEKGASSSERDKRVQPKLDVVQVTVGARLLPPENGVTVRMYRQGHGDCS